MRFAALDCYIGEGIQFFYYVGAVFHILCMRLVYHLQVIFEYNLPKKSPGDKNHIPFHF